MPALSMTMLVAGVVLGLAGISALARSWAVPWGLAGIALGVFLILLGAARLGRAIAPGAPHEIDADGTEASEPAHLTGHLDPVLSRWLWIFKWLLALPHYVVLGMLGFAFMVVTVAAGIAILFTGRYPASLFQFTVGVLRWHWRVAFYSYGVLGTDRYPPFTLARCDYPAEFDVVYPLNLSHWKVLFKSWLLALPQLLIVAAFTGGAWPSTSSKGFSLLGLLVLIAAIILLFTGVYRLGLFNLLMGIHRWSFRTMTYVALMSDRYPPFRLDQGALDPPSNPSSMGAG
ncbi:protein of unknown function [Sanguibacter gelidistatuariae]|uniref:DUF4389 domain-containing protein n=1 Tax=Sanguibacter gelidistatuariae TaxID=1814289 RepID=A0A1G6XLB8_9MICO|nr:protein of unknown function [Sanguibacter gelidistatuariae]